MIRILPLGDSITQGTVVGGYRMPLEQTLTAQGMEFDFIGSTTFNSGAMVRQKHGGFGGLRIDQIRDKVIQMDAIPAADYVLLDAGTNDFVQGANLDTMYTRYEALLTTLRSKWPTAKIIPAAIGLYGSAAYTAYPSVWIGTLRSFNAYVMTLPFAVAMPLFLDGLLSADGIHPTSEGYTCMAWAWEIKINGR